MRSLVRNVDGCLHQENSDGLATGQTETDGKNLGSLLRTGITNESLDGQDSNSKMRNTSQQ